MASVVEPAKSKHKKNIRFRWDRINLENYESEIFNELLKYPNLKSNTVEERV